MRAKKENLLITLLGVLVVVSAVMAAVVLGLLPLGRYNPHPHPHVYRNACIANLKRINGATETWAQENKKTSSDIPTPTDLYGATAYIREEPTCPQGGKCAIGSLDKKPHCSIPGHTL